MEKSSLGKTLQKYTMIIALVAVIIFFYVGTEGKILLPQNINNLLSQNAYVFVLATGMLLCILTGGNIDLSVGSVIAFAGGIGAMMMSKHVPAIVAVLVILVVGMIVGAVQGYFIAYVNVPPFIATLAGMYAFRGLANVVHGGQAIGINDELYLKTFGGGADCYIPDFLGHSENFNLTCMVVGVLITAIYVIYTITSRIRKIKAGYEVEKAAPAMIKLVAIAAVVIAVSYMLSKYKGIPTALIWIAAVILIYQYVTTNTRVGRYLYAVGGNEKATRLSGINTKNIYFLAYVNMGLLAGLAGILTTARAVGSQPTFGQGYEMDAIAACFIGGASAYGGIGTVPGVIVGAVLMGVINQGMSIMAVDANYQKVVKGIVLLVAVAFDVLSKREKK